MLVLAVLALIATVSALPSPVQGPWSVPYTVDVRVSYANASAGLVQVDVGAAPRMRAHGNGGDGRRAGHESIGASSYSVDTACARR